MRRICLDGQDRWLAEVVDRISPVWWYILSLGMSKSDTEGESLFCFLFLHILYNFVRTKQKVPLFSLEIRLQLLFPPYHFSRS